MDYIFMQKIKSKIDRRPQDGIRGELAWLVVCRMAFNSRSESE